jgi:hypothetical protein
LWDVTSQNRLHVGEIDPSQEQTNERVGQITHKGSNNGGKFRANYDPNRHIHNVASGNEISEFV